MSANAQDFDFDEYDKPGAERSRRRRGEEDTLESDLEDDLLEEDWLSSKKNPLEVSDEELNDDLLQSDDEDINIRGQDASYSMGTSYDQQDNSQNADYTDDVVNLGAEGYEEGDVEGYREEEYTEEYNQDNTTEMAEDQIDYSGELAEGDDGYQDEVLDIQITEPLDGEFQDEEFQTSYALDGRGTMQKQHNKEEEIGKQQVEEDTTEEPQIFDTEEGENETLPDDETKEESNEEEDDDEESCRMRFKSERKDGAIVRLADASSKRRNIPETLELSEKAKKDLMEFEEQERQRRQSRYGNRGRGGGGVGGRGGRGGCGRGFSGFAMADFRGGKRGRIHDHMLPLMVNMNLQPSSRMPPPYHQQLQSHQHHPSRPRGPPPFQDHGRPIPQQSLQPLIPHHMAHRSPPQRPQMEPPPRIMNSPPPNFSQHHQHQPMQPKNIHINPHFRGPAQSPVQVPLMPPAQSQPRPAVGPQRFPGPGDFQQHMPGNFGQPQRPPHHMEPLRSQPPQGPQDREPMFMGECADSARFPGQRMFDHQGHSPLMNSSNNLHHQQQLPGQGHMGFGPPGPPFNQPGQGPLGLFQRESPRPNLPPHQGHQGMVNMNQQGGPPNQPRPFMGPRQPFGQQGNLFPSAPVQFGMQVRLRGLMHGPSASQLQHHDPLSSHPMHQHRHELSHHQQQQMSIGESRPIMLHGQNPFRGQGGPRQMSPRPQNPQHRNMSNRQRMNAPVSKQQQRNSNLRELPVAPGNTNMNSARPSPTSPTANIKPVARTTQGMRPGLNTQLTSGSGRGRGQVAEKTESQPGGAGGMAANKEMQSTPSSMTPQDPYEDEETRQYRLKIEEQKRLREEILRRKEMRRQMQAGVRKKELLERLNAQTSTQSQGSAPLLSQPAQPNQQTQHPEQQPATVQQQPEQKRQQQLQAQQQRQFPQGTQSLNHALKTSNHDNAIPANSVTQTQTLRPNVKTRLQMVKGSTQQQESPGPGSEQQQPEPNQQQQRKNFALQSVNRPDAFQGVPGTHKNIPATPSVNQSLAQAHGLKPGAKRTVMQRAKSVEGQQVPQKVRVVKLSGPNGKEPEDTSCSVQQQQGTWQEPLLNQGVQRKVTMMESQQHGPGGLPQDGQGDVGNPQQSRVVVSGRGRGRGSGQLVRGRGRGAGQMGRGHPVSTRQSQRDADNLPCTVSIEGLSSSTTEFQLKNLLRSIGPIEMFKMLPQQRKAIAKFSNSEHAASFQMSFHRHMIDLSHIDVSLIDG